MKRHYLFKGDGYMGNRESDEEFKEHLYSVVGNRISRMKCIKCSECSENILMVPTLDKMVEAIENHVRLHRTQSNADMLVVRPKVASIRADLTEQVRQQA